VILEKYEILHGGRFEFLAQLLQWALWPKVNHIQMKIRIHIKTWIGKKFGWNSFEFASNWWLHPD
jgi:hypothetical protein